MVSVSVSVEGMFGLTWPLWRRLVAAVEELGFAGLFRSDHFTLPFPVDLDSLEAVVSLTYAAEHTSRVHFGPLVAPLSFRDPVMLARQAAALDDLSDGRLVLGLGAGWMDREHEMFGYPLGDIGARFARFGEGLAVITGLLRGEGPVSFEGEFCRLRDAVLLPRPARPGGPPILIGGSGPRRTLPLVARYADIWNGQLLTPAEYADRNTVLDGLIRDAGRRPEQVRRTMAMVAICGRDPAEVEARLDWLRRTVPMFATMPLPELTGLFQQSVGAFIGTTEELTGQLRDYAAAGADEIILQWAGMDDIAGLTVLAEQVLPALTDPARA